MTTRPPSPRTGWAPSRRTARSLLLVGILVSAVGTNMAQIALDLQAAAQHSSPFLAALLIGQTAPAVLLGLVGGGLADRHLRWWWWPLSLLMQGLVYAVMASTSQPAALVVGVTVSSTLAALTGPVASKLFAHYTDDSARSGGRLATVSGASQAIGVMLGAVGFSQLGAHALLALDAATFVFLALIGCAVATRDAIALEGRTSSGLLIGFRRLLAPHALGRRGFAVTVAAIFGTSLEAVTGIFVLTAHAHLAPAWIGAATALWGIGVMIGGRLGGALSTDAVRTMTAAACAMGATFVLVAWLLPPLGVILALYLAGGVGNGVFNAKLVSVILGRIPADEQGRTWAAFRWISAMCFLGGYLGGAAFGTDHARLGMGASGAVALLVALLGFARARRPARA